MRRHARLGFGAPAVFIMQCPATLLFSTDTAAILQGVRVCVCWGVCVCVHDAHAARTPKLAHRVGEREKRAGYL